MINAVPPTICDIFHFDNLIKTQLNKKRKEKSGVYLYQRNFNKKKNVISHKIAKIKKYHGITTPGIKSHLLL